VDAEFIWGANLGYVTGAEMSAQDYSTRAGTFPSTTQVGTFTRNIGEPLDPSYAWEQVRFKLAPVFGIHETTPHGKALYTAGGNVWKWLEEEWTALQNATLPDYAFAFNTTLAFAQSPTLASDNGRLLASLEDDRWRLSTTAESIELALQQYNLWQVEFTHLHADIAPENYFLRASRISDVHAAITVAQEADEYRGLFSTALLHLVEHDYRRNLSRILEQCQKALDEILYRIVLVKNSLFEAPATFCGRSWTRRIWHLLHGSHPPKTAALLPSSWCLGGAPA
jgi:hypothetical protein